MTDLGKELIRACNQLKILIDLSHLNERGFWDFRRIIEQALGGKRAKPPPSKEIARKASTLAEREIEPLGDKSMPPEEQARRKRALIRGPKEFRDIRGDQPKSKI